MHAIRRLHNSIGVVIMMLAAAGSVAGAEMFWQPVGATGAHAIVGNEIRLANGGQRVFLEIRLAGWGPDTLTTWQGMLDPTPLGQSCSGGANNGNPCFVDTHCFDGDTCTATRTGPVALAVEPCSTHDDCVTAFGSFGTGAVCDFGLGACKPGWQDSDTRPDFVILGGLSLVSTGLPFVSFGSTQLVGPPSTDTGGVFYGGVIAFDVPVTAAGSYDVIFATSPSESFMVGTNTPNITPLTLTGAVITVVEVACDFDSDCNDLNDCTEDRCVSLICTHTPEAAGLPCGDPSDSECDLADSCDDAGFCLENFVVAGTACGDATTTDCDGPDQCDGGGLCDLNFLPNGTACGDGDICTGSDECQDGACTGVSIAQAPTVEGLGAWSLDITPQPPGSSVPVALRITSPDWACLDAYIDATGALVDIPTLIVPSEAGTINVTGPEIAPLSTYEVVAECGAFTSATGSGTTWKYGDFNHDQAADFRDIRLSVDFFLQTVDLPLVLMDIAPCVPDMAGDFRDITAAIGAFLVDPYPCPLPCE